MGIVQSELSRIQGILHNQKITITKGELISQLGGRLLTFRELAFLHRQQLISDHELGVYMDMKSYTTFTKNHVNIITNTKPGSQKK